MCLVMYSLDKSAKFGLRKGDGDSFDLSKTLPCSENQTFDFFPSTPEITKIRQSNVPNEESLDFDPYELHHISLGVNHYMDGDSTIRSDILEGLDKLSLLAEGNSEIDKLSPSQQFHVGMTPDMPSVDSGLPTSWSDICNYPRTSSKNLSVLSLNGSELSKYSQSSRTSSVCSCSTVIVEKYIKSEAGFSLIETHLIPQEGDIVPDCDCSIHSHNLTAISDWLDISSLSQDGAGNHIDVIIPQEVAALSNSAIRAKLMDLEDNPGPVTGSTRDTYLKRLVQLERDPDLARRNTSNLVPGASKVLGLSQAFYTFCSK